MDMVELISVLEKGSICLFSDNNNATQYGSFYHGAESVVAENEKLQLTITHKDEIIASKNEIISQKEALLESQQREIALLRQQLGSN